MLLWVVKNPINCFLSLWKQTSRVSYGKRDFFNGHKGILQELKLKLFGFIIRWSERRSLRNLASKDCHLYLFRDCYLGAKDPRLHL